MLSQVDLNFGRSNDRKISIYIVRVFFFLKKEYLITVSKLGSNEFRSYGMEGEQTVERLIAGISTSVCLWQSW